MSVVGIHHVAIVSSDLERTLDHYRRLLGLRLLAGASPEASAGEDGAAWFGNDEGEPGSLIAVREAPGAEAGHEGVGGTHHFAWIAEDGDALRMWKRRLTDAGVAVNGPLDRHYFESIYHRDPDGQVIEIATRGPGWTRDEAPDRIGTEHRPPPPEMVKGNRDQERIRADTWPDPVGEIAPRMRLSRMHHVTAIGDDIERTHDFVGGALGLRRIKRTSNFDMPDSWHWYWGTGQGEPGTVVTYFERKGASPVRHGPGQTSHYALAVADAEALEAVRARLREAGYPVSEPTDGRFFRSFTTTDPHGQTVEIATTGPGFAARGGGGAS